MITELNIVKRGGDIINEGTNESINMEDKCSICCDNYGEVDKVMYTACNHYFHKTCLVQWLWEESTCPLCKKELLLISKKEVFKEENPLRAEILKWAFPMWIVFLSISFVCSCLLISYYTNRGILDRRWGGISLYDFPVERVPLLCENSWIICGDNTPFDFTLFKTEEAFMERCTFSRFICMAYTNPIAQHFLVSDTPYDTGRSCIIRFLFFGMAVPLVSTGILSIIMCLLSKTKHAKISFAFMILFCLSMWTFYLKVLILSSPSFM